jgi:WD40 repeat protein
MVDGRGEGRLAAEREGALSAEKVPMESRLRTWLSIALALALATDAPAAFPQVSQLPRVDSYGDPLPEGALLRIGTTRLRPGAVVKALAFSPDGKQLVTANPTTGVQIWDVATGKYVHGFSLSGATLVAVSSDGTMVAALEDNKECKVWSVIKGTAVANMNQYLAEIADLQFSPDGKVLALTTWRRVVKLWDIASRQWVQTFKGNTYPSTGASCALTADGKKLASISNSGPLVLFDGTTGKELHRVEEKTTGNAPRRGDALLFSPDGTKLGTTGPVELWDVATGKLSSRLQTFGNCLTFTPDGRFLLTDSDSLEICYWDAATGKQTRRIASNHHDRLRALAISPDGKCLATSADDCTVRLTDLQSGRSLHEFQGHQADGFGAWFLSDGKAVVSTSQSRSRKTPDSTSFHFWDARSGKEIRNLSWAETKAQRAVLSRDGGLLAAAYSDGRIMLCDVESGKWRELLRDRVMSPESLQMSCDGAWLMWHDTHDPFDERLAFKPRYGAVEIKRCKVVDLPFKSCYWFTHENSILASFDIGSRRAGFQDEVAFYDVARGKQISEDSQPLSFQRMVMPPGHSWAGGGEAFPLEIYGPKGECWVISRSGRLLIEGTSTGMIVIKDDISHTLVRQLAGHRGPVCSLGFSPDGKRLVTTGDDISIVVWDFEAILAQWRRPDIALSVKELESLWHMLKSDKAHTAIVRLLEGPKSTVAFLRQRLSRASAEEMAPVKRWVADLNSEQFSLREKASAELLKLGDFAVPILDKVLGENPTLEVRRRAEALLDKLEKQPPSPARLQQQRALETLELLETAEARELLITLAGGAPEAWLTQQAKAACRRAAADLPKSSNSW